MTPILLDMRALSACRGATAALLLLCSAAAQAEFSSRACPQGFRVEETPQGTVADKTRYRCVLQVPASCYSMPMNPHEPARAGIRPGRAQPGAELYFNCQSLKAPNQ